jgi:hypothetical protein
MIKKIVNPYIKKPENKKWLLENWETFIGWMALNHSMTDCWHTILDLSTFNDLYIEKIIQEVEATEKRKEKEEKLRKAKRNGKKVSELKEATAVEKKIAKMEEAAKKIEDSWEEDGELLD